MYYEGGQVVVTLSPVLRVALEIMDIAESVL